MHSLLGLSSLLLVALSAALVLGVLRRLDGWARRRDLQVIILAAPVVSLTLSLGEVHHFLGRACFLGAPTWDYLLGVALPLVMGGIALGGLALGLIRLILLPRFMGRRSVPAGYELQARADHLAELLGVARPCVRLCAHNRPLALTYGLYRPTVLLSTWMVQKLDARELEAVLAHELGHVVRRDYLVIWLATILRDAFCYLPSSWAAYRQLQCEKELACDELAVGVTQRPLALASALAKVWQYAIEGPGVGIAQSLTGAGAAIEQRITRLLDTRAAVPGSSRPRLVALSVGTAGFIGLVAIQTANVAILLAPMGCGPVAPLWRLFV